MNPQDKIGVLTFHRCINYGSYWQARCLVEGLQARGRETVLLEHHSNRVNLAEWRCALKPVLPTPVPKSDHSLYADKTRKFFNAFAALPCSPRFSLENPADMESYDLVIVGSDEVWNLKHPWYGGYPLFYGSGVRATHLASYAASFGNYPALAGLARGWVEALQNFEWISVRDQNSRQIIQNALGTDPELVLDPCLQFPPTEKRFPTKEVPPYVAIYGHNFTDWFIHGVRHWATTRGYPLVSIGYRNDWADQQWLSAGPEEFADFISQAGAVATNFFHGCVFALLNRKPFVCELSEYRSHKVRDLMTMVGGERHLITEKSRENEYVALLSEAADSTLFERIATLRQKSLSYLDQVLSFDKVPG